MMGAKNDQSAFGVNPGASAGPFTGNMHANMCGM